MKQSNEFFDIVKEAFLTALILLIILLIINLFTGCKSSKELFAEKRDTLYISRVDSGQVKKSETKSDLEWWREIVNFRGKDSTYIEKTIPIYQPVQIIREGGVQKVETINIDSVWVSRLDSLAARLSTIDKKSKTTVFGFWQIAALSLFSLLLFFGGMSLRKVIR